MVKKRGKIKGDEQINVWNSLVFKLASKGLLGLGVILAFLSLVQCTIKKPESPTWDTAITVPVINRTYSMDELVAKMDQDEIGIDSTGAVAFSVSEELDTVSLGTDDLSTPDLSYSLSEMLGPITIAAPTISPVTLYLSSIIGLVTPLPGDQGVVTPGPFTIQTDMPTISTFSSATITSGMVMVVIDNGLGVDLDTVTIQIYDDISNGVVAAQSFAGGLPAGVVDSLPMSLDNKTISNDLRIIADVYTPGGGVLNLSTKYISTEMVFIGDLTVTSAVAEVPSVDSIPFSQPVTLDLDPGESIDTAGIATGALSIAITNGTGLGATLSLTIPELEQGGAPYTLVTPVGAGQTVNVNNDLAGYLLVPSSNNVNISAVADIPGSGSQQVAVDQFDAISIDAGLTGLTFSSVTGVFNGSEATFDGIHEELDIPEGFDEITLKTAVLTLAIENGIDMLGVLDIVMTGDNGKSVNLTGAIAPRGDAVTTLTTITNTDVADFLSPLPSAVDIAGAITYGGGGYQGTITGTEFVASRVTLYAPLEVIIDNAEVSDLDIESEEIDQDDIDLITDHVIQARFIYTMTNHLPLGATAVIHLGGDSASLYTDPQLTLDTMQVDPAPVSLSTGVATAEQVSSGEIFLDSLDIKVLENDTLFIRPQLFLTGSESSGVKLTQDDYITLSGRLEIVYRFDGEF